MNIDFVKGDPIFTRINKIPEKYEYLSENINTDVIIVGGGVTGCILGYYFSKNNINNVILEKNIVGYGSTSITTALLQYELDSTLRELEQYTTFDKIIQSYKVGIKALKEIDEFINRTGNLCEYQKKDTLLYTAKKSDIGEIKEEYSIRKDKGFNVKYIDENNNPFSFDLKAGLYSIDGGAIVDPYKFAHQLLIQNLKLGGRIYENTEVVKVNYKENKVEALCKYGYTVTGKIIIIATGYNTSLFTNRKFGTTTATFNIATNKLKNLNGYYNEVLIRDNKVPYNYFRSTKDKRIIGGGDDIDFLLINDEKKCQEQYQKVESNLRQLFNLIPDISIEYKYCGAFTSTQDNLGFIGKDPDNSRLWYNLGYGANGILFSMMGGKMLSKLYNNEIDEDLHLFKVDRFDN